MSQKQWKTELVLLFIGAQFLCFSVAMLTASVLRKFHVSGFQGDEDFGIILCATLGFQGVTWILIPIFLRLNEIRLREMFGLNLKNFGRAFARGFAVLAVALALEFVYESVLQKIGWQPEPQIAVKLFDASLWPAKIYLSFFAVVLAPVAEEFIFRSILFSALKNLGLPKLAWMGVSLLFAAIHNDATIFIPLFFLALMLTWLYEKTGNLLASVIAHALFNAVNLAGLIYQNR